MTDQDERHAREMAAFHQWELSTLEQLIADAPAREETTRAHEAELEREARQALLDLLAGDDAAEPVEDEEDEGPRLTADLWAAGAFKDDLPGEETDEDDGVDPDTPTFA